MHYNRITNLKLPQRIAYFSGSMKPGLDGVSRVLYRIISALQSRGIDNVFYSAAVPPPDMRPTEMVEIPSLTIPFYKDYRFAFPGQRYFASHILAFNPDLIHINSPCSLSHAALRFGQQYGIPVVATYHTHFPSYAKYYKVQALEMLGWNYLRKLYNQCQRVYVPSQPILAELSQNGINNLKYLPHGVDTATFNPVFKSMEWKKRLGITSKYALLYAGRLVWEKDLQTLAMTYQILTGRRNDLVFVLAGDGPIRKELEQLMPEAKFLGYQAGSDLSMAYASSDLFVFPSTTETFGNVTIEAMASGLLPVCANQGGAAGIIKHGITGMLTNPRDPADLVDKIEYLIDHPEQRRSMAERALNYARQQTWERIFDTLFRDYENVIEQYDPVTSSSTSSRRKVA
jgi:phosphatidylinositol alpha 1,6-mannosyltransferase